MHDLGTPQHSKRYLQSIIEHFPSRAELLVAEYGGRIVGGMFILRFKEQARDPWTSTLRTYNRFYVSYQLYYAAICYGLRLKLKTFDFGRSQHNSGTFRFKKQWGCLVSPLYYHDFDGQIQDHQENPMYTLSAKVWAKIPYCITNWAGQYLRKYLA
jgi:lipid II:glycine glycyltransferase (peptidoglycan interpeptide bridge formation enzyme)